jgi:E3 ubiquitin-protein ligase BRE1
MKELNNKNEETEYELEKISDKAFKLDRQLAETLIKYQKLNNSTKNISNESSNNHIEQNGHTSSSSSNNYLNKNLEKQVTELEAMLEEHRELSSSRLQELEKINLDYQSSLKQIEKLRTELKTIPESVIEQSSEYKNLQTKYSLIVNDNMKLRQAFEETRNLLEMSRLTFQRQLEQMESEELANQKKLGSEMMHMEEQLASVRKENELLRIEYEQNVAANEQTGPINKEMRSLITTLQANNKLLKSDIARTKKRLEEAQQDIERYKKQNSQLQSQLQHSLKKSTHSALSSESTSSTTHKGGSESNNDGEEKKDDDSNDSTSKKESVKNHDKHHHSPLKSSNNDSDTPRSDKNRLKETLEREKNKKPSNSTIASPSSSSSTSHHVSSSTGNQVGDEHSNTPTSSNQLSSATTTTTTTTHSSDSHYKKIRQLEDQVRDLHKNLSNKKQEEAALLNDMEITGQAFEDMQASFCFCLKF